MALPRRAFDALPPPASPAAFEEGERPSGVVATMSSPPAGQDTPLVRLALMPGELERVVRLLRERPPSIVPASNPRAPEPDEDVFVMKSILWTK